jgi:hypothetical protein
MLDLFERVLVSGMRGVVNEPVAFVIEARRGFGNGRRKREKTKRQENGNAGKQFHGDLSGLVGKESTPRIEECQVKKWIRTCGIFAPAAR